MNFRLLLLIAFLSFPQNSQLSSVVGAVSALDQNARTITIKTDQMATVVIRTSDETVYLRVPPGAQSLEQATAIKVAEIAAGDRVLARGTRGESARDFTALRVVVLSKTDVDKRRERDLEDWRKRGVAGVVRAINPAASEIQLELRGVTPATPITIQAVSSQFRRYTQTSINFENTKQSNIAEIVVGDQLRALGEKSADGKSIKAESVVSGSFKTIGATIVTVDAQRGVISATTLDQKKPIQIATVKESTVFRIPASAVPAIVQKVKANSQTEVQQIIDALPAVQLSDLKAGDVVSITGIRESEVQITAIKLVAGIDAVLRALAPAPGRPQTVRLSAGLPNAFDFSVIP